MKRINAGLLVVLVAVLGAIGINTYSPAQSQSKMLSSNFILSKVNYVPLLFKNDPVPPLYSTSYYMLTVDSTTLYNMGCKLGQVDRDMPGSRDTVVVLDFGSPKKVENEYGADLFWMGPVTNSQITSAVKNFGMGYYTCVSSDRQSQIYVGIGTTNYHTNISNATDFWNHGVAWAQVVNNVNDWFKTQGYSGQVLAVGADDIELSWNTPVITKAWVNGYNSAHKYDWYNFGTLDGCAKRSAPNYALCGNGWTRDDAWYVVYGTQPVWPLPEIYLTSGVNAQQWALLSLYSNTAKGYTFEFMGVFTQMQACIQAKGQCTGVDNSPADGWNQLSTELSRDPRTMNMPRWSTDIKWWDSVVTAPATAVPLAANTNDQAGPSLYQDLANQLQDSLASPDLNQEARSMLQGKLDNTQRMIAEQAAGRARPAPKDAKALPAMSKVLNPDFQAGIFDGAGGVFHSWEGDFQNHWQGIVDGQFVFVSGGSLSDDLSQGIVMVMSVSADRLNVQKNIYRSPAGTGSLQVVRVEWPDIYLASQNGQNLVFDIRSNLFK